MTRVLVIDDQKAARQVIGGAMRQVGYDVTECSSAEEAIALIEQSGFDVVLTDLQMPGKSGLDVMRAAAARLPECILVLLTARGSLESAIESLRIGAHDYLLKPLPPEVLVRKVGLLVRHQAALAENRLLRGQLESGAPTTGVVGSSPAMEQVRRMVSRVAPADSSVLITGETGTGKEVVARAIHETGPRREKPFVAINCGSIPEALLESELFGHVRGAFTGADRDKRGLFEVAAGGTLFLDEIGEMPLAIQPKLLRALEAREILPVGSTVPVKVSARILAATNRPLSRMVEEGRFRADLFYRVNTVEIPISPLRERKSDIREISKHLLERLGRTMNRPGVTLEPDALTAMELYRWPGNVRELSNVLERALLMSDASTLKISDLPGLVAGAPPQVLEDDLKAARAAFERAHILRVIDRHGGDKTKAAQALGVDLSSLYRKLQE